MLNQNKNVVTFVRRNNALFLWQSYFPNSAQACQKFIFALIFKALITAGNVVGEKCYTNGRLTGASGHVQREQNTKNNT